MQTITAYEQANNVACDTIKNKLLWNSKTSYRELAVLKEDAKTLSPNKDQRVGRVAFAAWGTKTRMSMIKTYAYKRDINRVQKEQGTRRSLFMQSQIRLCNIHKSARVRIIAAGLL